MDLIFWISEIILILPWILVSLGLIGIALYLRKKDNDFKNKGIKTTFKVKDVFIDEIHHETGKVTKELTTVFEFYVNGQFQEIEIPTTKEYEINEEIEGYYLEDSKYDKISAPGIGFFKHKYAEVILIGFAIAIIAMVLIPIFLEK